MYKFFSSHLCSLLLFTLATGLLVLFLTYCFVQPAFAPSWDYTKTGAVGDTFGGIAGTIVAFIAAIMALCAFGAQYEANESLAKANELQQIQNSISEHISLLSSIKLYDREAGGAKYDCFNISNILTYSMRHTETLLREGSEALFILYQKFFILHFVFCSQYTQATNKYDAVVDAYKNFILERGYLFNHCINHSLIILQDIESSSRLSEEEKNVW